MGFYNYKSVVNRDDFGETKKRWEAENGECDGDPGYDGHYWSIAAQLLDEKDAQIAKLMQDAELGKQLCAILSQHVGETGESEGAMDVLKRLLREHKCPIRTPKGETVADRPERIEYLNKLQTSDTTSRDLIAAGWTGPGWYFWDETDAYCHGPFKSEQIASDEMTAYGKQLDGTPAPREG